eukprot:CAMPEP_0204155148 /NCGR_PEP_ID=MMETSP0361-20130328/29338_1 /ASSEMBLY_ACC=CAM_ASM_000343 /TAXON_ID=268821 /ORGANISM="Scrippsiella Hangoei, Strain SHTV-5" /LENGTH=53 /DNA_ID=CAMNT_0051110555 /DNA_START=14 /DNA_END=172 /DNA_ORIENTATION=-
MARPPSNQPPPNSTSAAEDATEAPSSRGSEGRGDAVAAERSMARRDEVRRAVG